MSGFSGPTVLGGAWTPIDSSGAGLTLSAVSCSYTKIGNMVFAYGTFTMPVTANASAMLIGGLPFAAANATYAVIPSPVTNTVGVNAGASVRPVANSTTFNIFKNSTGANATNADFTGSVMTFNITYPVI